MSFNNEINKLLLKYFDSSFSDYRYFNIGGRAVYIEGQTGLVEFDEKTITFKVKKQILSVVGKNLVIAEFDNSTAVVTGNIESVVVK